MGRRGSVVLVVAADSRREKTNGTGDTFPAELKVSEAPFSQDLQIGFCVRQRGSGTGTDTAPTPITKTAHGNPRSFGSTST